MKTLKDAIEPLAQYLAQFGLTHEIHKTIVADLYDRVNAIRDSRIEQANELMRSIVNMPEFLYSDTLQTQVSRLEDFVSQHQGE